MQPPTSARRALDADGLDGFLAVSPDAVVVVDHHGTIRRVNDRVREVFGCAPEELVGRPVDVLLPPRFRAGHAGHRADYFAAPGARGMGQGRYVGLRADGAEVPVDISLTPVVLSGGEDAVAAVVRDISERVRFELDLEEANDQLRRLNRDLGAANAELVEAAAYQQEFVATASHELRTPLTAIRGFAETILQRGEELTPSVRRELLTTIVRNADRQGVIVGDLLDASRIRSGTLTLDVGTTDLRAVLDRCLADRPVDALDVRVADGIRVLADEHRLCQVVWNLLTNAERYGAPPLRIDAHREGDRVVVEVSDGGAGVPPEFVERMFEPFTQASSGLRRASSGMGLGLYIVRSLVAAMEGTLEHERRVGRTVFRVGLRAAD